MCNLYSMITNREAIGRFFRFCDGWNRLSEPANFLDKIAPIVRPKPGGTPGEREMVGTRWGMPTPPMHLKPGSIDRGHEYPEHEFRPLARLAEAGEPLPRPCNQLL